MSFQDAKEIFDKYVDSFDPNTYRLNVKYEHSYRVVKYAEDLAHSLNLNEHDFYLAQVIALFHDVSRFKQGKEYGTFNDLISFDHGDVAAEIMVKEGFIEKLADTEEDKNIILKAVKNHNKYKLEEGLTERELFFSKIARDADKIDILDTQKNEIKDGSDKVSDDVYKYIQSRQLFKRESEIEHDDYSRICMQIAFVFDIYFKRTYEILDEKKILRKKLDLINNAEIESIVNSFIDKKMRMF